ncbi:GNAT family N-acetyltransferase [Bacillus massiliglaciei]|uniref:GNAT family N-acetyltransferase n=1 Tax=Bacillus massiliglaciei TaxID=1816693 RepID=UPI000AA58637|nr:GNAT family N-acetyltransferase [Bacillus massiliglaciei]
MNVYQAELKDLRGITQLFNAYRRFYQQPDDMEGAESYLRERMERGESIIFVAEDKGECVGFVQLYPTFSSISMRRAWILNDLFVMEEYRSKGIGQMLIDRSAELCRETGAAALSLETAADNFGAQRLYERNGFSRDPDFWHYSRSFSKEPEFEK